MRRRCRSSGRCSRSTSARSWQRRPRSGSLACRSFPPTTPVRSSRVPSSAPPCRVPRSSRPRPSSTSTSSHGPPPRPRERSSPASSSTASSASRARNRAERRLIPNPRTRRQGKADSESIVYARPVVLAVRSYDFSVFLHVTAVVIGFGSTFAESITFPVAIMMDKRHLPYVHRLQRAINQWMTTPAMVVILATGFYQVSDRDWDLGDFWLSGTLGIVIVLGAILGMYFIPEDRRLQALVER